MNDALKQLKISLLLVVVFTVITGLIYPLLITGFAQFFFPWQANGSLIEQDGKIIGSLLIGQSFDENETQFWGRPSMTTPYPYNGASSNGSNMGPSNPAFLTQVSDRIQHLQQFGKNKQYQIPVDLVTASASGLDPEISPLAAIYQIPRIAEKNHLSENDVEELINQLIQNRTLGILGEPRINVLELNLALNKMRKAHGITPSKSR